jgi:hypothetical protein
MASFAGRPRRAAGLAVVPLAILLAAACGGSDTIDTADGSALEDALPDASGTDSTVLDSGSQDADAALQDAENGSSDADAASTDADAAAIDARDLDSALPEAGLEDGDATSPDGEAGDSGPDATSLDAELDGDVVLEADAALDGDAAAFDSGTSGLLVSLGTADPFVVLGGATITNADVGVTKTVLLGDIGTTGPAIVGLTGPPTQPSGTTDINDARAMKALLDVGTAYTSLAGEPCSPAHSLTGLDLGGMTLVPGVYCFTSSASQTAATTLTFDAQGDPDAVWVIQVKSELTIGDHAAAVVIGGPPALACRIFWAMGTEAVIGDNTQFLGNVIASSTTVMLTAASLSPGRAFGITAGVTLLGNSISAAACP